ncbi:MAG TPA: AAA family ATPase, partial [Candidatus Limnocylindria bacterium]
TTGEAAVSFDIDGEGMVTGDMVNAASRLQERAVPGTVLVDDATRRVVGDAIRFEAAGELLLKGRAAPVTAWLATEVARPTSSESRAGHRGPFVGRRAELRTLGELLESVVSEHRMTVVSIVGVAGIGKSRLAWELEQTRGAKLPGLRWHAGRPPGWGEGVAFAPLAEMLRRAIGVTDSDPSEVVRRAVVEELNRRIGDGAERAWIESRLLALLQPGEARVTEREELFGAWRRFLEAESEAGPLVLLFEDLQWADAELLDFIDYLADWSRRHPILVLALARPELLETRPTWGAGLPSFTALHLDRLSDADVDALLAALAPDLPRDLAYRVRQRADGVPLYAVEMARMLTERSAATADDPLGDIVDIPESLHALLAARIDALPAAERSLLLTAAVLGRRFRPDALAALSGMDRVTLGHRLRALVRREFLAVDDEPGSPGRGQLSFVQDLVREVAYNTLSRRERRARHLAVIEYLESIQDPDAIEPIADHLVAAHAALRADQPEALAIADRAQLALRQAADRARALHAPQRALGHLERALSLTQDAAARADTAEAAAMAARAAARFEEAEGYLREAIDLRDAANDAIASTRHRAQLASLLLQAQRSDTALAELEAAWELARMGDGDPASTVLPVELARAHLLRGDTERAIEWAGRAIDGIGEGGDAEATGLRIDARVTLGTAYTQRGDPEQGLAQLRRAIDEAAQADLGSVELRALNNLAWLQVNDDPRGTSDSARRGLELARKLGIREWSLHLLDVAAIVAIDTGEWDWALASLEEVASEALPTVYRLDFAATRAMIGVLRGAADPLAPIQQLGELEPDLDPQALGWVDIARALAAMIEGDLAGALELAEAAARKTVGWERAEALALTGRVAAWSGNRKVAAAALKDLGAEPTWGRVSQARLRTLRAAVRATGTREKPGWDAALRAWRELGLPLREALSLIDRWRLGGDVEARDAARAILAPLGAEAILRIPG